MEICEKRKCTGCSACYSTCPKNAITMENTPKYGWIPLIDMSRCVKCGACVRVCPNNVPPSLNSPMYVWAGWSKNSDILNTSSSGGIAAELSRWYIERNGVVYGAVSDPQYGARHVRIVNKKDLKQLRGSKYVQSFLSDCFQHLKDDLEEGKQVLFVGTGCQVSGLRSFLRKDYEQLYIVDLICHGTPASCLLTEYLRDIAKTSDLMPFSWSFRENNQMFFNVDRGETNLYRKIFYREPYYLGFELGLFLKESCYQCPYASLFRAGDITLGDFHELGGTIKTAHNTQAGSSLVFVNTEHGQSMLDSIQSHITLEPHTVEEAIAFNPQLRGVPQRHSSYDDFFRELQKHGFTQAARKFTKRDLIVYTIKNNLGKFRLLVTVVRRMKRLFPSVKNVI